MKTFFLALTLLLPSIQPAQAGGGGFAGATETTQIMNNLQLAEAYAQQVMQYQNELMQYQTMIKNLAEHPLGYLAPEIDALVSNHARVIAKSKDIGSSLTRVDQDFAAQFQSETAASYADQFRGWTTHSNDGLKAMMLNAGLQRENFATDEAALKALVEKNKKSDGNLGALKTVGEINAQQLQESMKLRDLISRQQIAQGTYLASQNAKEQTKDDMNDVIGKSTAAPSSKPSEKKYKY